MQLITIHPMQFRILITGVLILVSPLVAGQKEMSCDGYYVSIPDSNSMTMFEYYLRLIRDT
jgi:hypothetical protein